MFKGTQGIILVYDISNRDTFINVKKWSNHIKDSAEKDVCVLLCGNKLDKDTREVNIEEGENIAKECNFLFLEMSAKSNINIKEGFEVLVEEMNKTYGSNKSQQDMISIKKPSKTEKEKEKQKQQCCYKII